MSETVAGQSTETGVDLADWKAATLAGIIGGIAMGVLYSLLQPTFLQEAVPGIYGLEGGVVGWVLHVSHAAILGVVFAAIVDAFDGTDWSTGELSLVGLGFGVGVWLLLTMFVVPVWNWALGASAGFAPPELTVVGATAHLLYGLILGAGFGILE